MMTPTHIAFSVSLTSIVLATSNPVILISAGIASLLPDIDTSKSLIGRLFFPVSQWIEQRHPHRGISHSFFASGMVTLASYILVKLGFIPVTAWHGLAIGYFWGWFGDVFTKSGVEAFYPFHGRLIIPKNPKLRLSSGSNAEWFLLIILASLAALSININSTGGMIRGFSQALGLPSGAITTIQEDASRYLLNVTITGRNTITEQPINAVYEAIEPLTSSDLLVKDKQGLVYRVGSTQDCQIQASQIRVERVSPIKTEITNLALEDEDLYTAMQPLTKERTYLTGTLTILDAEDLSLPTHADQFDTITLQPGEVAYARLVSANPQEVKTLLGDYYATGNLIVRTIHVR